MADLDRYLSNLAPPKWPFTETNPINQQMASEGQAIYARDCAACHEPPAKFTNKVIPITEVKTDPERMYSWSKDAAAEANRRVKKLGIDRPPMGFKEPRPTGPSGELTQPYFLFDTQEKGNGNQGHTYGTQLSKEDKEKLLEYLKTL
jgi:cbb3-type cytochrome c oxidase subunit III